MTESADGPHGITGWPAGGTVGATTYCRLREKEREGEGTVGGREGRKGTPNKWLTMTAIVARD